MIVIKLNILSNLVSNSVNIQKHLIQRPTLHLKYIVRILELHPSPAHFFRFFFRS